MAKDLGAEDRWHQTTRHTASIEGPEATDRRVPALTVLAHPDVDRVGEMATLPALLAGQTVELSRLAPVFAHPKGQPNAPLEDVHLSRRPLRLLPGPEMDEVTLARAGSSTRVEIDGEPLSDSRTFTAADLDRGAAVVLGHRIALMLHRHHPVLVDLPPFGMVGESTAMLVVRQEIQIVARLRVPVLLRGESGTGKELIARAIHASSARAEHDFLAVNMAAMPPSLAASELFGATRGAYTGAVKKKDGYFLRAHRGTLLLDEIGDTPIDVQPLLLRALENGEIQPVGADAPRTVDVRLISATDADLEALIADGGFRKPLLHRLAGYEIRVPPLRARRSDFGSLLFHFLRRALREIGIEPGEGFHHDGRPWPPADLVGVLARHPWPGNVRQLENAARRLAIARRGGGELGLDLITSLLAPTEPSRPVLRPAPRAEPPPTAVAPAEGTPSSGWRPAFRKPVGVTEGELLQALRENQYSLQATAVALNVSRGSLYNLVRANPRIRKASELTQEEIEQVLAQSDEDIGEAALRLEVSRHGLKLRMKALDLRQ